jgi:hypothetical protein
MSCVPILVRDARLRGFGLLSPRDLVSIRLDAAVEPSFHEPRGVERGAVDGLRRTSRARATATRSCSASSRFFRQYAVRTG